MNRADPATLAAWLGLEASRSLVLMDAMLDTMWRGGLPVDWTPATVGELADNAYASACAAGHYGTLVQGPINPVSAADPIYQMRWGVGGWESGGE